MNIAVYYGSTYGNTADAAERIAAILARELAVDVPVLPAGWSDVRRLERHDVVLVGCSTWDGGELQPDWGAWCDELDALDLRGTRVALFGTGDQVAYADTFVDALGILATKFEERGANLVGSWSAEGYEHAASRAQRGSSFVGLALDYDNQDDATDVRIERWTAALLRALSSGESGAAHEATAAGADTGR